MREIEVRYYVDDAEMARNEKPHSEEYQSEFVEANSTQEAIDLVIDYVEEQVIQNSEYEPEREKDKINVIDGNGEIIERYYGFSVAESPIKSIREELGMSQAETARLFEMPVRTLQDWEARKRTPPHWAEKLVLEKMEQVREEQ